MKNNYMTCQLLQSSLLVLAGTTVCWYRLLLKTKDSPKACLDFP